MSEKQILDDFYELAAQLVITENRDVAQLIAVATDDEDYYWVCHYTHKTVYSTCVGGVIALKGRIDDEKYERMLRNFKLNAPTHEEYYGYRGLDNQNILTEFRQSVRKEWEQHPRHTFITDLYFDEQ